MAICLNVVRNPGDLIAHAPSYHISDHLKIADERPKREAKAGGFILFDDKMGKPCETVTDYKKYGKEIPLAACNKKHRESYPERRADKMKPTRQGAAMLGDVEIPKFGKVSWVCRHIRPSEANTNALCGLFQFDRLFFGIENPYVPCPSQLFEKADGDPVHVKLIPLDAVPRRGRCHMMIIVPAFAKG